MDRSTTIQRTRLLRSHTHAFDHRESRIVDDAARVAHFVDARRNVVDAILRARMILEEAALAELLEAMNTKDFSQSRKE